VPRKRILALIVTSLMLAMVAVLLYEAFDIHDTQPFGVDPELPLFMLGSMLLLCIGTVVLIARLLGSSLALSKVLSRSFLSALLNLQRPGHAFEIERLLFSPPLAILSLRI